MSGPAVTGTPTAGAPESGTPKTGTPNTGTPNTGTPNTGTPNTGTPNTGTLKTDRVRREELSDEEAFLLRSLEDLDREHAAGDLDATDYEALRSRYEERAAAIVVARNELDALAASVHVEPPRSATPDTPSGTRGWLSNRRHRLLVGWSAVACFALAGALVGLALAGVAPFAKSPPLTDAAQVRIELGEAGALAANHDIAQAVAVYDKVLELDPSQPEALADGGWLVRLAGLSSKSARLVAGGDAEIAAAVKVAPGYALARAYDAIALYADRHLPDAAVHQLRAMLADHPSSTLLSSVRASAVATYRAAGIAVPTVLSSAKAP